MSQPYESTLSVGFKIFPTSFIRRPLYSLLLVSIVTAESHYVKIRVKNLGPKRFQGGSVIYRLLIPYFGGCKTALTSVCTIPELNKGESKYALDGTQIHRPIITMRDVGAGEIYYSVTSSKKQNIAVRFESRDEAAGKEVFQVFRVTDKSEIFVRSIALIGTIATVLLVLLGILKL